MNQFNLLKIILNCQIYHSKKSNGERVLNIYKWWINFYSLKSHNNKTKVDPNFKWICDVPWNMNNMRGWGRAEQ